METPQQQTHQQPPQQPKTSTDLMTQVIQDLSTFIKENKAEDGEADALCYESAEQIAKTFKKLVQPAPDGPALPKSFEEAWNESDNLGFPQAYLDEMERSFISLLKTSLHQRITLANLVLTFISEFGQGVGITLEEDDTGYVASNFVLFTQTVDRILDLHQQQVDDLKSTYKVLLSNASYPAALKGKISTRAALYLFRYHTTCAGCKKVGDSTARPCAKSPIHGAPLCQQCLDIEKDSLFFNPTQKEEKE